MTTKLNRPPVTRSAEDLVNLLWRLFSSAQVAAVGLGLLGAALVAGALIPRASVQVRSSTRAYEAWLDERREVFGPAVPILDALGLFNLYNSWWFRLLLCWLAVSLGVYVFARTERRIHPRRGTLTPTTRPAAARSVSLSSVLSSHQDVEDAARAAEHGLRSCGYAIRSARTGSEGVHLLAERNRWHRLANVASHLGMAGMLIAAAVGQLTGWQEPAVAVAEGSHVELGHGSGLSVRVNDFTPSWHTHIDAPRDYVTDLTLLKDGVPVRENFLLRVNAPLSYEGVSIHQAFFGPAIQLRVRGAGGETLYHQGLALTRRDPENRPAGSMSLPGYRLEVLAPRLDGTDTVVRPGTTRIRLYRVAATETEGQLLGEVDAVRGTPVAAGGLTLLFERETQYSGLHVTKNPAVPYVWGGAGLMLVGMMYVFALPYRQVRVRVEADGVGSTVTLVAGRSRPMGRSAEFERVVAAITLDLGAGRERRTRAGEEKRDGIAV